MQEINVRIMQGKRDIGELKATAMANFLERQISHLDPDSQIEIYKSWIEELEREEGNN